MGSGMNRALLYVSTETLLRCREYQYEEVSLSVNFCAGIINYFLCQPACLNPNTGANTDAGSKNP